MSGQPFTLDPLQAGTPPPKPAAPPRAAAPISTFTIDPTQVGNPPNGKSAGNAGASAPSGTFTLDPQELTANKPQAAPQQKQPTQPNEEEIKKKYGLPATADLSKEFLDESNRDAKDPVAFSQAYQEMHPPKPRAHGFFSNVAQESKDIVKGMLSEPAGAVPSTDVSGALETSQSLKDAATSARQGKVGEAAIHATEAVPMVGQPIAARIRQAQTGDRKGALGAALVDALMTALGVRGMLEGETPGAAPEAIQPETALPRPVAGNLPAAPEVKALPPGPRAPREAIGEGLQSNIGPGEKPIPLPERTPKTIPPSEKPIAAGPTTIDPRELTKGRPTKTAATAPSETKAPSANDLKLQIKQLDTQYRTLNDRLVNTRKFEVSHKITAKQRVLAAKIKELRGQLDQIEPRPEAKPLSRPAPEDEKIGSRIGGAKTYQQERPTKAEAAPSEQKQSKTPTYDRLPPEMREAVDSLTAAHSHLPQMLREANEADMRKLSESGTARKEQYARLVAKEAGIEPEPKNTGSNVADLLKSLGGEKPEAQPLSKPPEEPELAAGADERTPIGERRLIDEGLPAGSTERRLAERRANVAQGAGPVMRRGIIDEANQIIKDPEATPEEKRIAQERIADLKAHPGETGEPADITKVRAAQERTRGNASNRPEAPAGMTWVGEGGEPSKNPRRGELPPRTADTMSDAIALSSPSGRMSERARTAATERLAKELFGERGLPAPKGPEESETDYLRRNAKQLRELADRGTKPQAHIAEAQRLEAQADALESRKEPWQMTRQEWYDEKGKYEVQGIGYEATRKSGANATNARIAAKERLNYGVEGEIGKYGREAVDHKEVIQKALSEGKPVPANVLADYPNLARKTEGTLPGMETAVREQAGAAAQHKGEELTKEIARPLSNIDERAGTMERESPLFRDTEASGQKGLFSGTRPVADRVRDLKRGISEGQVRLRSNVNSLGERLSDEEYAAVAGSVEQAKRELAEIESPPKTDRESLLGKSNTLHLGVDPEMVRDLYERLNRAYQEHIADPAIEKLGLGRTHKDVEAVDPKLASRIRRYEAAPQYFRTKAEDIAKSVTDGLTREQERLFSLMADQQSRENLQANHPKEFAQALADKDVQAALARYKPYGDALTKAHSILGGAVMPGDHLPWVYPEHVSGMGQRVAETDTSGGGFDRGVTPQRADQFGRTTTAEYHYAHGLHEFGPAFARKFSRTMTKLAEHATAMDFLSKATAIEPGDRLPPMITYNGKRFYSPEVLQMIREATPGKASHELGQSLGVRVLPQPKNAEAYARYQPTGGKTTPTYLGPRPVVQALKGLADSDPGKMDPVGRFLQEQVIGMGFGVRHGFNLFRRITQTFPLGVSSPVNWIRAVRVMTDRGLRERALARTNDPAYDALLRWSAISPEGVGSWKEYQGGNLNPANWLRTFAKVGNRWLFEPGGVDQKARLWMRDLLKSQRPDINDEKAAQLVRDQLGNYSRENWTKNQKLLSHVLLFPGWDFSTINWVIRHPIKTAIPPAILVMLANRAIHRSGGKQEPGDEWDPFAIHAGGHAYGTPGLEEPLARAALKPFGRAVQARLEGQTGRQAAAEGVRAVPQALAGVAGMTRPDLAMPFEVAAGKTRFGRDIVPQGDFTRRGTVLPNKGAEDIGAHILKAFFPPLERATEESQSSADALLSNFGLNRYQEPSRRPPASERTQDIYNAKDDIRALERQAAAIAADRSLSADEKQRRLLPLRRKYQELVKHDRPQ